jgi:hypothetical protein
MAGSALLLGIASAIDTTDFVLQQAQAEGIAQQLIDEVAGCRYVEPGANPLGALGPENGEVDGASRAAFDDLDDYAGLNARLRDPWGVALGTDDGMGGQRLESFRAPQTAFENWRQQVDVYYASPSDLTQPLGAGQTSNYRIVRVRIYWQETGQAARLLAERSQVFTYVPQN